jgi:hypothetical protein
MSQPLDYRPPEPKEPPNQYVLRASRIAAAIVAIVNAIAVIVAACLPDFGPMLVMIAVAPTNLILICCSWVLIPTVQHYARGGAVTIYLVVGTLSPIAAFLVTESRIMALHKMQQ